MSVGGQGEKIKSGICGEQTHRDLADHQPVFGHHSEGLGALESEG